MSSRSSRTSCSAHGDGARSRAAIHLSLEPSEEKVLPDAMWLRFTVPPPPGEPVSGPLIENVDALEPAGRCASSLRRRPGLPRGQLAVGYKGFPTLSAIRYAYDREVLCTVFERLVTQGTPADRVDVRIVGPPAPGEP